MEKEAPDHEELDEEVVRSGQLASSSERVRVSRNEELLQKYAERANKNGRYDRDNKDSVGQHRRGPSKNRASDIATSAFWSALGDRLFKEGPQGSPEQWVRAMAVCADQVRSSQKGSTGSAIDELQEFRKGLSSVKH